MKNGALIGSSNYSDYICLYNELDITEDEKTQLRALRGLVPNGSFNTINASSTAEYFFKIPTNISDNNIFINSIYAHDVTIRVTFKKNVSQSLVTDNNIALDIANMYLDVAKADNDQLSYIY